MCRIVSLRGGTLSCSIVPCTSTHRFICDKSVRCGIPRPVVNAASHMTGDTVGSEVTYTCRENFVEAQGDKTHVCTSRGKWDGQELTCKKVGCDMPTTVQNAELHITGQTVGSIAKYKCHPSYTIAEGDTTHVCRLPGVWKGRKPTCKKVCPDPGQVAHAVRSGALWVGETVQYKCQPGYEILVYYGSNDQLTCSNDGTWKGKKPVCEGIHCGDPGPVVNASKEGGFRYGEEFHYVCSAGFVLTEGGTPFFCSINGSWIGQKPVCRPDPRGSHYWLLGLVFGVVIVVVTIATVYIVRKRTKRETDKASSENRLEENLHLKERSPRGMNMAPARNSTREEENQHGNSGMDAQPEHEYAYIPLTECQYNNAPTEDGYMVHKCDKSCEHVKSNFEDQREQSTIPSCEVQQPKETNNDQYLEIIDHQD